MLTALEHGVQGGKWSRLIDKVYAAANLLAGYRRVAANKGAAGVDLGRISAIGRNLDDNLARLGESLRQRKYRKQAIRWLCVPKPGR